MKASKTPPGFKRIRRDRQIEELEHDSYRGRRKPPEPAVCPECRATFHGGRWQRLPVPGKAHRALCPACRRVRDRFPAGYVALGGEFLRRHRKEVIQLLRNVESRENAGHPLQRIMEIAPENGGLTVTTTDPRLARALGEAVHRAYRGGKLEFHYNRAQNLLRVHWVR